MADKQWSLNHALELAEGYVKAGAEKVDIDTFLQQAYDKLNELQDDVSK